MLPLRTRTGGARGHRMCWRACTNCIAELVAQSLPHVLNTLAECAPAWLQVHCPPAWVARYAARLSAYRLPKAAAARSALAAQIGADGPQLLSALWAADAPPWLRTLPALEALRQIWVQQYHLTAGQWH